MASKKNEAIFFELFEGKTLSDLFKYIFDSSVEERDKAMEMYKKVAEFVESKDDSFMQGEKAAPYIDSAHKATENIIKMIQVAQKIMESGEFKGDEDEFNTDAVLEILDNNNIGPDRFLRKGEKIKKRMEDNTIDLSKKAKKKNGTTNT